MHAVINHIHLNMPVEQLVPSLQEEGLPLISSLPGFAGFHFVKEAEDRGAIIIFWESAEAAMNGARIMGPGYFARAIAPHLASEQQRTVGPVLVSS